MLRFGSGVFEGDALPSGEYSTSLMGSSISSTSSGLDGGQLRDTQDFNRVCDSADIHSPDAEPSLQEMVTPSDRKTVVVVVDEPLVRRSIRYYLERMGHKVLEAADGSEAVRTVRHYRGSIDLLVVDIVLAGAPGPAVVREIQKSPSPVGVVYIYLRLPDKQAVGRTPRKAHRHLFAEALRRRGAGVGHGPGAGTRSKVISSTRQMHWTIAL